MPRYRTAPVASDRIPSGVPFIIANEAAERFSYYGMRAILVVFMTQYLTTASGLPDRMGDHEAQGYFHLFVSAAYFTPLFGALLSDGLLGKYRTIIGLSLFYCAGHFALTVDDTRNGLLLGLSLIALGAGGIKPCVTAHVGDQFGASNRHLLGKVFGWFYFAINLGAFGAMLLIPWLLQNYGSAAAFGTPGVFMLLATLCFWSGRHRFVHIPAAGLHFVRESLGRTGRDALARLAGVYIFVAMFWALFEQIGSSWVLQAQQMDRLMFGVELLPSQIQAANPLLIMLLSPLFAYWVYPLLGRYFEPTPLRRIAIGLYVTAAAFALAAWSQVRLDNGESVHIGWQLLAYLLLTAAEVMVSITCLEFSYTQAPNTMKSFVMGFYFLSVAAGNLFTGLVNFFIQNPDGSSKLSSAAYFWLFAGLMLGTALLFTITMRFYRVRTYLQQERPYCMEPDP